jgi:molybdate transport system regulatory protein
MRGWWENIVSLGMSYRRAWLLVDDMNRCFCEPVVSAQPGGAQGGGAALTDFGENLIQKYRAIEAQAAAVTTPDLNELKAAVRSLPHGAHKLRKRSIRALAARR